jgi:hypothetical protein
MNYSIFEIKGGIGKNIMATSVASDIKKNFPDNELIVVSAYPAVWINHPDVHRVITFDKVDYFYDNYIKDRDSKLFVSEPYHHEGYIYKRCHLIESWEKQLGLQNEEISLPRIYMNQRELQYYQNMFRTDERPILVVQMSGGPENQNQKYSWYRDLPIQPTQEIVNHYAQNGHRVIQVRKKNQLELQNAETFTSDNIRDIFGLLANSDKRLLIDSFCQHASLGMGLKSVVCWPVNNVTTLGYNFHTNIVSSAPRLNKPNIFGYLNEFDITGNLMQYDFEDGVSLFDPQVIVNELERKEEDVTQTEEAVQQNVEECENCPDNKCPECPREDG